MVATFSATETEFEAIMIASFFIIPYTIQVLKPNNSTPNMGKEIASAFFSFAILINCGSRLIALHTLAKTPTANIILSFIGIGELMGFRIHLQQ